MDTCRREQYCHVPFIMCRCVAALTWEAGYPKYFEDRGNRSSMGRVYRNDRQSLHQGHRRLRVVIPTLGSRITCGFCIAHRARCQCCTQPGGEVTCPTLATQSLQPRFACRLWRRCGRYRADSGSPVSGVVKEAPSPAQLSPEEQEAVDNKNAGRPYDQAAYNRAMQKIKQAEKYNGDRNKQKRNRR